METAKVDIQKLQLLNDRIAQAFDALNQVRFSVHGLSHSSQIPGFGQQGIGQQQGFGQGVMGLQGQQGLQGLTNPFQNPYQYQQQGQNPYQQQTIGQQIPWAQNPFSGLSHSTFGSQIPFGGITPQMGLGQQQIQPFGQASPYAQLGQPGLFGQQGSGFGSMGGNVPFGVNPLTAMNPFLGLSHTSVEPEYARPLWADPYLAAKVAQTFPFIQLPISPVGV